MTQAPDSRDNFCYRHPDRQSFVLCQRCGRTICGECQTQGAVGVICPECMKAQRKTAPKTKPRILTRMRAPGQPVATYGIIAVTVFVFLLQWIPGLGVTQALLYWGPYSVPGPGFQPWRMVTTALVHSQSFVLHVALNMFTLWIFGRMLEPMLGRWRLLVLYIISAFAGSLGVLILAPFQPVLGASGAIFGLVGAFFVIARHLRANTTGLVVLVVANFVIDFLPGVNVAWQAHLGGLVGGALVGLIYVFTRPERRRIWQLPLLVALSVLLVIVMLARPYV